VRRAGLAVAAGRGGDPCPAPAGTAARSGSGGLPAAPRCRLAGQAVGQTPLLLLPTFPAKNTQSRRETKPERETSAHWERNGYKQQEKGYFEVTN